ncbi:MAG TPA: hypothetical protein VJM77_00565 [Nitrospiria bacterium]|nr:hypothetical protein [Nitrospiria bacterium]
MKIKKIKDPLTDHCEKVDFKDSQLKITERMGEMHLLIFAIDPATPMGIKSATFDFPNRVEGLQMFNVLAATARNVCKTCVEEARRMRR